MFKVKAPCCVIFGCQKPAATKRTNKNGSITYQSYCWKHQEKRSELKLSKPNFCLNQKTNYLGFSCTATITHSSQLTLDHHDGNRYNNDPENLKCICHNCHNYKTWLYKDNLNRYNKKTVKNEFDNLFQN